MIGGPHRDFMVYAGRSINHWRYRQIYIGLWRKASCEEGEIPWLFEWSLSTGRLPRVFIRGTIELCAFGRCWVWKR